MRSHRRLLRSSPPGILSRLGFEVVAGWLPPAKCRQLVSWADRLIKDTSYWISEDAYFIRRGEAHNIDSRVMQIMNAQTVNATLRDMANDRSFEELFEERLGFSVELESITVQVDDPDCDTKRGLHVDRLAPSSFKAFVYLTDVNRRIDGPYTVVPGSHTDMIRKVMSASISTVRGDRHTNMPLYSDRVSIPILGPAGTLILSNQQIVHKGWSQHRGKRRYMLAAYLAPKTEVSGKPFRLSAELAGERRVAKE